jgi:hypothetical protein
MSQNPTRFPGRSGVPPEFKPTFKCPWCSTEKPAIMALNTLIPLDYFIGGNQGSISTLRTIVVCASCNNIISVQFLPLDLQAAPVPGQQAPEDDGSKIIV